ncbi:MAG: DnaB-like helicase N-terminal domain-containing protein, partial [Pseudomonadota bacterium]
MSDAPAPHNIEAEQAVLGAILLNNEAFYQVRLEGCDFFDPVHGRIFAACKQEVESGRLVSPVTLKVQMADDEGLRALGGSKYLLNLAEAVISLSSMRDYCRVLRGLTARREIIRLAEDARAAAMNPG